MNAIRDIILGQFLPVLVLCNSAFYDYFDVKFLRKKMINAFIILGCFILSYVLTGIIRRYAIEKNVVDLPNQRSSHSVPTPRGGGLSIVMLFYTALILLYWLGDLEFNTVIGFTGVIAVALIGFVDDHVHIRARYRLAVHFLVAGWGVLLDREYSIGDRLFLLPNIIA